MKDSWINLDAKKINAPIDVEFKGVQISIQASPFHTPSKAMLETTSEGAKIVKFMYDSGEPSSKNLREEELGEGIKIEIDPRNGRIYMFSFPKDMATASKAVRLAIQMKQISQHLSESIPASRSVSRGNYQAAINAMSAYSNQLAGA